MLRLYTDESPGLKVDPVVVLVLSLVFIFSVVALHSEFPFLLFALGFGVGNGGMEGKGANGL
jgi:protein transport protein SEC61 subunit beta